MEFSVCELCRKPLSGGELCPSCTLKRQEIQKYADRYKNVGVADLSKKYGISQKLLQKWVKNGYLRCAAKCRMCGESISFGTLCTKCQSEIEVGFKYGNPKTKFTGKMHIRNRKG